MLPDAVLFDLDGCLVDSEPLSLAMLAAELRASGLENATSQMTRQNYLGWSITDVCKDVSSRLGKPCPKDLVANYHSRLYATYDKGLARIEAMVSLLDLLQSKNITTAIASGGLLLRIDRTLSCTNLAGRFKGRIFSGEEVERGKPAPDLFLYAAEKLGVSADKCIVVEDSPHGIEGAIAAGMRAVGFTGGTHLDGIRPSHSKRLYSAGAHDVQQEASFLSRSILGEQGCETAQLLAGT